MTSTPNTCTDNPKSDPVSGSLFANCHDIGSVKFPGSLEFNPDTQEYLLTGSGRNMWGDVDEFFMVSNRLRGDFILHAQIRFPAPGVDGHRKAGLIVRSSLSPQSPYADVAIHGDGLASLQFRNSQGSDTRELQSRLKAPDVIQLARVGNRITMSLTFHGETFIDQQSCDLPLGDEVYVGLFITSHNPDVLEKAILSNVWLAIPAATTTVPRQEQLGSNLEILDIATHRRTIILCSPQRIEAPNWTPDGNALIYNSKGLLFRLDLTTLKPIAIDTDFAIANNNDHVLSFDGAMLGISHHRKESDGKSIIYVLPASGGTPRQVTMAGPSYLHGWSPDGKTLVYTAERGDGNYDVYSIPTEGGAETRLTTAPGLDDGPEFTPDGKWIYFNSVRSGTMQIWRMRPDGSLQQQLTQDRFNNWFPHLSPDGKWVAFLTYYPDVPPGDHPANKHVYLRLMPAEGGTPKVIAYLYGGQGTINVNSWSSDGQKLAFVSNSAMTSEPQSVAAAT